MDSRQRRTLVSLMMNYLVKKCFFPIHASVVWCPTCTKKSWTVSTLQRISRLGCFANELYLLQSFSIRRRATCATSKSFKAFSIGPSSMRTSCPRSCWSSCSPTWRRCWPCTTSTTKRWKNVSKPDFPLATSVICSVKW